MASVWMHKKGVLQPEKVRGHMGLVEAKSRFESLIAAWKQSGGKVKRVCGMEVLFYTPEGALAGGVYIEPYSPPSAPERGQPRRTASA